MELMFTNPIQTVLTEKSHESYENISSFVYLQYKKVLWFFQNWKCTILLCWIDQTLIALHAMNITRMEQFSFLHCINLLIGLIKN